MLKSRMLGKPLVRFCEGRGGNRILSEFPKHPVYSTSRQHGFKTTTALTQSFRGYLLFDAGETPTLPAKAIAE